MAPQHNHSNQYSDMLISSDDTMQSSIQGLQQVSDHLDKLFDTYLTRTTSVGSNESLSVSKDSLQASISVSRLSANNALNL